MIFKESRNQFKANRIMGYFGQEMNLNMVDRGFTQIKQIRNYLFRLCKLWFCNCFKKV